MLLFSYFYIKNICIYKYKSEYMFLYIYIYYKSIYQQDKPMIIIE